MSPFAKKSLGQNFLVDKSAISKILSSIPHETELLLEIGPGRGALSTELFHHTKKFCVLEKDDIFAKNIGETLFVHGSRNHTVLHEDALAFDWNRIWSETHSPETTPLIVVANLPYNVATEILFHLLKLSSRIPFMALMFQKEVAQRIAGACGTKHYGGISIAAQNLYEVKLQQILKPGAFRPSPKVDSAVVEFHRRTQPRVPFSDQKQQDTFSALVKSAFAHRRKTIENSLHLEHMRYLGFPIQDWKSILEQANIQPKRRAETVSIEEFGRLFSLLPKP